MSGVVIDDIDVREVVTPHGPVRFARWDRAGKSYLAVAFPDQTPADVARRWRDMIVGVARPYGAEVSDSPALTVALTPDPR